MELIKRKILREELITRANDVSYGNVTKSFIYLNIFLTQDARNIGIFSEQPFEPSITSAIDKDKIINDFRPNFDKKAWYKAGSKLTATTDSKLVNLKGYKKDDRFKEGFDSKKETYINYKNVEIKGVSRITQKSDSKTTYVFDTPNNGFMGTSNQTEGLLYEDLQDGTSKVTFQTQGINMTNSSLSALTKEEFLMGIINKPEIQNDVFIDRGEVSPMDPHLRLSEVDTLEHLMNYGNGYYNVTK